MNQKKIFVLSIMAMLFTSIIFSTISLHFGLDIDTSPVALGQYGGGSTKPSIPSASTISNVTPELAYAMLHPFGARSIAGVLSRVENSKVIAIFLNYASNNETGKVWNILAEMSDEKTGSLLIDMEDEASRSMAVEMIGRMYPKHAPIIEIMINTNSSKAARLIEDTTKTLVDEFNETQTQQNVKSIADILNLVSPNNLTQIFIQIAEYPETPRIVAYLFESMDPGVVLNVINKWINLEKYEALVDVLDYLSSSLISVIYRGIENENRIEIYPFFSEDIISQLPDIGFFQISNLIVTPNQVDVNEPVKISFTLTNIGNQTDDYSIPIIFGGETLQSYSGILENGALSEFEYDLTTDLEGNHSIIVDTEVAYFNVGYPEPIKPPELRIDTIHVIPIDVIQESEMKIFVIISNIGDELGYETYSLEIDGNHVNYINAELSSGETRTFVFTYIADFTVGDHTITIENMTVDFTVSPISTVRPLATITITVIILIGGTAYYLYERGYFKKIITSVPRINAD